MSLYHAIILINQVMESPCCSPNTKHSACQTIYSYIIITIIKMKQNQDLNPEDVEMEELQS